MHIYMKHIYKNIKELNIMPLLQLEFLNTIKIQINTCPPQQPVCTCNTFTLYTTAALPWHLPWNMLPSELHANRTHKIFLLVSTTSSFEGKSLLAVRFDAARSYVSVLIKITWRIS